MYRLRMQSLILPSRRVQRQMTRHRGGSWHGAMRGAEKQREIASMIPETGWEKGFRLAQTLVVR